MFKSKSLTKKREEGQGLVEYALILVLVAVVVIVILTILGPTIQNVFVNVINNMPLVNIGGGGGSEPQNGELCDKAQPGGGWTLWGYRSLPGMPGSWEPLLKDQPHEQSVCSF